MKGERSEKLEVRRESEERGRQKAGGRSGECVGRREWFASAARYGIGLFIGVISARLLCRGGGSEGASTCEGCRWARYCPGATTARDASSSSEHERERHG